MLLLGFSDIAYRQGSIYTAIANRQIFVLALTILMTGMLLLGLLEREKHGVGNIGFEKLSNLADLWWWSCRAISLIHNYYY